MHPHHSFSYAHIEIVAAFLVVNVFSFLAITVDHGGYDLQMCHVFFMCFPLPSYTYQDSYYKQ